MKFSDVKNRTCLYLLGGIAGLEGSVLNIITTKDDKLFFEFCNDYDELGLDVNLIPLLQSPHLSEKEPLVLSA